MFNKKAYRTVLYSSLKSKPTLKTITMKPYLSICITSYNRVAELLRCIESIEYNKVSDPIEVIISEDVSPKRKEIKEMLENFKKANPTFPLITNYNENNLGYDRNLGKLISLASGEYILFSSDDDSFIPSQLSQYIAALKKNSSINLAFSPFVLAGGQIKRKYNKSFNIEPGENNLCKFLNDGILFSGLTFKREVIEGISAERFLNTYYFQIYLFLSVLFLHGAGYFNIPLISCNGDGENGFGLSNSSVKDVDLADRNSIFSNLKFHEGLIKVIRMFDDDFHTDVLHHYSKEYSLRSYPGMSRARMHSLKCYKEYLLRIEKLDIKLTYKYKIYKYILYIFGSKLSNKIMSALKYLLIKYRQKFI